MADHAPRPYADLLDLAGQRDRQRKVRSISQDSREPDVVTATLLTGWGYTVERRGMLLGDWGWELRSESWLGRRGYVNFLLERKTLADLRDVDRLESQVRRARLMMAEEAGDSMTLFVVLVEHTFDTDPKRRWSEEAVRNAKLSLQLGGMRVADCGENQVADTLDSLYRWSQKRTHSLTGEDT